MRVSRNFSISVQYVLDQLVPPIIRDSKWFMYLPMRLVVKDGPNDFMSFKNWIFKRSEKDIDDLYNRTAHVQELQGETSLNQACADAIVAMVKNSTVLEVGAGRGYLANRLAKKNKV